MTRKFLPVVLLVGALALVLTACTRSHVNDNPILDSPATPAATSEPVAQPVQINSLADLRSVSEEIVAAPPAMAQARADQLWQALVTEQRGPLIFDRTVVFMYKGRADRVDWRGDFNAWAVPGLEGQRIGQSDLWIGIAELPPASRAAYNIVVNDKDWLADPVNPHTGFSGLTGVNSVVTMPGFAVTDKSQKRNDVRVSAFYIGASQSRVFHNIAMFSPALWVLGDPQHLEDQRQVEGQRSMMPALGTAVQCGGETGIACPPLPLNIFLTAGIPSWDMEGLDSFAQGAQERSYPIEFHQVQEGHGWGNWRGLTDEMLIYFFGTH